MKFKVKQSVLVNAIEKGGLAALSETILADLGNVTLLTRSLKITIDKHLTISSFSDILSTEYTIEVKKENGIVSEKEGSILVPAKELLDWVKSQESDSAIEMELSLFDAIKNISGVKTSGDSENALLVKQIGTVKLLAKEKSGSGSKWELDAYDSAQVTKIDYPSAQSVKLFEISTEKLLVAIESTSFASMPTHHEHVMDSISIQEYKGDMYFAATDTKRCSLYKGEDVTSSGANKPVLAPIKILTPACKILPKDSKIDVHYDEAACKFYLIQNEVKIRMTCPEKTAISKFPNILLLLQKEYLSEIAVSKSILNKRLSGASVVNKYSALFNFEKDKKKLTIKAISEDGKYKPNVSETMLEDVQVDARAIFGIKHMSDILKVIKAERVILKFPSNLKSLRIEGEGETNHIFFIMAIDNPKYKDA